MAHAIAQTYIAVTEYRARITAFLLMLCAVMVMYYGVSIYKTISMTVALDKAHMEIAAVTSTVGTLNSTYLDLSRSVTPDKLGEYGLSQGHVSEFISRSTSIGSVALSQHTL